MTDAVAADPPASSPAKVDPETLSIRSRVPRALRFRRGAIIGAAALGSSSLMGIACMALKPQVFRQVAQESDLSHPMSMPGTDALSVLQSIYAAAPQLGRSDEHPP